MFLLFGLFLSFVVAALDINVQGEFTVHFGQESLKEVTELLTNEGFEIVDVLKGGWYHVRCTDVRCLEEEHMLRQDTRLQQMKPIVKKQRKTRTLRGDLSPEQFYITCERFGRSMPYCQKIQSAWTSCANGTGSTVAVVDDGVAWHTDYAHALDIENALDVNFGTKTAAPSGRSTHGTSVAGIIISSPGNDVCGTGIAFGSRVVPIRLIAAPASDADEAKGISHKCEDLVDIFQSSWGPRDIDQSLDGPGDATKAAMKHCIEQGRNGRGTVYVWAAGNGGRWKGNTNFDGYVNQRYVMGVAAVDSSGHRPSYGEIGSANFITAASSGGEYDGGMLSIVSTTYNSLDTSACTRDFGGTSAAAPQISAGVALMLSCRPDLTWRDVHSIIAHSGQVVDSGNGDAPWQYHSGLMPYSEAFGFGLLDFERAVTLAKSWALLPPERVVSFSSSATATKNIDAGETVTFNLNVVGPISVSHTENIVFKVNARFDGSFADMISLKLTAPNGRVARFVRDHDVDLRSISWAFKSPMWWDMNPVGMWNLTTTNGSSRKKFVIESIEMNIFGI